MYFLHFLGPMFMDKEYTVLRFCTRSKNMIIDKVDSNLRQKVDVFTIFDFLILRMSPVRHRYFMLFQEKLAEFLYFVLTSGVSSWFSPLPNHTIFVVRMNLLRNKDSGTVTWFYIYFFSGRVVHYLSFFFVKADFHDFMILKVDQHFSRQLFWTRNNAAESRRTLVPCFFKKRLHFWNVLCSQINIHHSLSSSHISCSMNSIFL